MFSWLLIIILAYLFFSLASFGDKLVLNNSQNPKSYVFYVGLLNLLVILLIPFVEFSLPSAKSFLWIILTSFVFIMGLYVLYSAIEKFEVSRVVPIVGAVQPIFILFLSWFFWGDSIIKWNIFPAFLILLLGGVVISFEKKPEFTKNLLKLSLLASFLTALGFIFTKMVFSSQTFFNGIIWLGIFNFLIYILIFFHKF